jgi:hypothetical protein
LRVEGSGLRVEGSGFRVWRIGFRVDGTVRNPSGQVAWISFRV